MSLSKTDSKQNSIPDTIRCPTCGTEVSTSVTNCPQDGTVLSKLLQPGAILSEKYEIIDYVGSGAMGVVYKAKQTYLNVMVAVKTLHPHAISPERVARLHAEARATFPLRHQNICSVLDFDFVSKNEPYLVMDFVDGSSLSSIIGQFGSVPIPSAIKLFLQTCDGLAYVHENGILHRDLKPSNIIVRDYNSKTPHVKIVDFGIAKSTAGGAANLTMTGEICGSPPYMSPEQVQGRAMDARSDVYSLGCVLYEALTGTPPFIGSSQIATMMMHVDTKIPRLSAVNKKRQFPPQLEEIVSIALAKDPDKRFQSARDFADALKQFQENTYKTSKNSVMTARYAGIGAVSLAIISAATFFVYSSFTRNPVPAPTATATISDQSTSVMPIFDGIGKTVVQSQLRANIHGGIILENQSGVSDEDLAILKGNKGVRILNIHGTPLTDKSLKYAMDNPIIAIRAGHSCVDSAGLAFICTHFPKLESLELEGLKQIKDNDLAQLKNLKNLKELNLSHSSLKDSQISYLTKLQMLDGLDIGYTFVSSDGLRQLEKAGFPRLRNLVAPRTTNFSQACLDFRSFPALESLNLDDCCLTDSLIEYLRGQQKLTDISLNDNLDLKFESPTSRNALRQMRSLRTLSVVNCELSGATVDQIKHMLPDLDLITTEVAQRRQGTDDSIDRPHQHDISHKSLFDLAH